MSKLLFSFFLVSTFCVGQTPIETQKFTPEELKQDLQFLFEKLESIHPSLYHYTSKQQIDERRIALEKELDHPMTRLEFARKAIPVVTMLQDGHTSLGFPKEERVSFFKKGGKIFPLDVLIRENKIFISSSPYDSDLLYSEILSINGISTSEVLENLRHYVSAELDFYRDVRVQMAFRGLLWYFYGWDQLFDLQLSRYGLVSNRKINGKSEQELREANKKRGEQQTNKPFSFYKRDNIGIIDFRSMSEMEKFDEFLDSTFTVIKNEYITNLIVDIRRNGGGNSQMGDMLINYITDKPYQQIDRVEIKNSAEVPQTSQNKIDTITVIENKSLKKPKNPKYKFTGKTYLLTSHVTFSSANMLADAFKCYQMGTIVGEETGGVLTAFGDLISIKLPNTQLQAGCAYKKFTHPCADDTLHGVKPDVEIVPTLEDIQNRKDPAMEYVIKAVKNGN